MAKPSRHSPAPSAHEPDLDDFGLDDERGLDIDLEGLVPLSPIEGYPYDGSLVELTKDGLSFVRAYWRKTRVFRDYRWRDSGFWALRHTKDPVGFEPTHFRRFAEEPLLTRESVVT